MEMTMNGWGDYPLRITCEDNMGFKESHVLTCCEDAENYILQTSRSVLITLLLQSTDTSFCLVGASDEMSEPFCAADSRYFRFRASWQARAIVPLGVNVEVLVDALRRDMRKGATARLLTTLDSNDILAMHEHIPAAGSRPSACRLASCREIVVKSLTPLQFSEYQTPDESNEDAIESVGSITGFDVSELEMLDDGTEEDIMTENPILHTADEIAMSTGAMRVHDIHLLESRLTVQYKDNISMSSDTTLTAKFLAFLHRRCSGLVAVCIFGALLAMLCMHF
eukprot:Filipodium_phascolosomae@DN3535_c0_g1_i1.p1